MRLKHLFIISLSLLPSLLYSQTNQELEELKQSSFELFNEGDYQKAMPLYSQLLSLYPSEAIYSYYYGACLVENNKEIDKAIKYLKYSARKLEDVPQVYFYLGNAYHLSYQFDKAIDQYKIFQAEASIQHQKENQVEREINICNNGLDLVKYISPLTVLDNKSINKENFEYSYNFDAAGGKLALKPDLFKTKADIKQKNKELIFISDSGLVLFSSLGKRNKGQKDLYWTVKGTDGKFTKSKKLPETINTEYDEDFPFLKSDGKTLYFSSEGHNTMGGFDIFKSVYDSTSESWSQPENLDFPTNTPYDDILYVIDSKDSIAYFASMRESEDDLVNVYKIEVNHNPIKQTEVKLEEIKQLAKLLTTPLAVVEKQSEDVDTETAVATTEVSNYKGTGPKTVFSFKEVYSNHVSSPEDYTKVLRKDIEQLKEMLSETESKSTLASNIAHQKLGKVRELNDQIETRQKALSKKEQVDNKELKQLTKALVQTNNQAYIAAKVSETLNKEVTVRKRELKITELLLNDSSNNNTQELVQNINANRKFLEKNNKNYLSIRNLIKEKESELNNIDKNSNVKEDERSKKLIHFNQNLLDYKACLADIKNNKDSTRSHQAKSSLSNIKYELDLSKNELIAAEKKLKHHNNSSQKLEEEIVFLKTLLNELSDKEHLAHTQANNSLDHKLIVENAKAFNQSTLKIQSEQDSREVKSKYEEEINENKLLEKEILAEAQNTEPSTNPKESNSKESNPTKLTDQSITLKKKNETNLNRAELADIKSEINETNLAQIISLDARKAFKKAQLDAQISDSLYSLANEKETRVAFVPNTEQQDIIKDEIIELKQLSNIKAKQAIDGYSSASLFEKEYISEFKPDSTIENLIKEKVFSFESSKDDSPELIEYKKATFKDQYYQSQLNRLAQQKEIIEKALEDDSTQPTVREKFQFDLSTILDKEKEIKQKLAVAKDTEKEMELILIANKENYPISKEEKYNAATQKNLSNKIKLSKKESKALKPITKEQVIAKSLSSQWQELVEKISASEKQLNEIEDDSERNELKEEIKEQKTKAWSIFIEANESQQSANQTELNWLADITEIQKGPQNNKTAPLAYVFEKESELLIKNAANLRESTKIPEEYNLAVAQVIEKVQLYESIAINRQKSAIDIYANTESSKSDTKTVNKPAIENHENEKPQIELLPDEADQIAAYEKKYNQAEAKEIKAETYWAQISELKNDLETAYSAKEQNSILAKIEKQSITAKEASYSAYLIRKEANQKKFDLYQEKNSAAIKTVKDKSNIAVAKHYLLDAEFYKVEAEKIDVDPLLEASDMLFQQKKKLALEDKALLAQEFAFSTLNGDDIIEENSYSALVKTDLLITKDEPIDKDLIQNVQANRILKKIDLNKSEIKALKKTEKLKKEQKELRLLLTEKQELVILLKDSLEKTTDNKLKDKLKEEVIVLEEEAISYQFSIAQNAEAINFEKYLAYKNHIKENRLKGKGNKAKTGRTLEKEANRSIRKAQNLRTRSYEVMSSEKAVQLLLEAQSLELDALENMEKAYTIYFDLLPIEHEVKNYIAKNTEDGTENSGNLTIIESKGNVEAFNIEEFSKDSINTLVLEEDTLGSELNLITDNKAEPIDLDSTTNINNSNTPNSDLDQEELITEQSIPSSTEINQDSLTSEAIEVKRIEEEKQEATIEPESELIASEEEIVIKKTYEAEIPTIDITESPEQTMDIDTFYVSNNTSKIKVNTPELKTEASESSNNNLTQTEIQQSTKTPEVEPEIIEEEVLVNNDIKDFSNNSETLSIIEETNNTPKNNEEPKIQNPSKVVIGDKKYESTLSLRKKSIYTKRNPIPVNPSMPSGIVYKIQIGAFTKAIPQNSFNGLSPVSGETRKDSKYIRYFVGLFNAYEAANVALPFIKQSGYKDAFIVAYKNGQRIAIYLAKKEHESNTDYPTLAKSETEKVLKTIEASSGPIQTEYMTELLNPSQNINKVSGIVYTVQIGVFKDEVSHSRLKNLKPLYKDNTKSGLIRYMVGQYTDFELANKKKTEIRELGIKDAFVTAYKSGQKISISQAREELKTTQAKTKIETQDKLKNLTIGNRSDNETKEKIILETTIPSKYNLDALSFRVQIGVFSNTVPVEVVSSFIQLSKLNKLDQFVNLDGKTVYTLGSFISIDEARVLKDDLLKKGIVDAFIIAYDGKQKVPISEALKLLKQ